jgi:hypothetical protein
MPNRHDIHLTNVFLFDELTKISPRVTQHYAESTNSTQSVVECTASSMRYTPSAALPRKPRHFEITSRRSQDKRARTLDRNAWSVRPRA